MANPNQARRFAIYMWIHENESEAEKIKKKTWPKPDHWPLLQLDLLEHFRFHFSTELIAGTHMCVREYVRVPTDAALNGLNESKKKVA